MPCVFPGPRAPAICLLLTALAAPCHALQPGDLLFTAYNADEDGWAMVALVDLAADTEVFFTDNDRAGPGFGTGEGYLRWQSSPVAAGTVLRFSRIDSATAAAVTAGDAPAGTLSRVWLPGSTAPNLAQSGDTLYAYQGLSATQPAVFLSSISAEGPAGLAGRLAGTGLQAGLTATMLPAGTEYAQYTGPRQGFSTVGGQQRIVADPGFWLVSTGAVFVGAEPLNAPFTPVPDAPAAALGALGAAGLWAFSRRPKRQPQHCAAGAGACPGSS